MKVGMRSRVVEFTGKLLNEMDEEFNNNPEALDFLRNLQVGSVRHEDSRAIIRRLSHKLIRHRDVVAAYVWLQSCILEAMQTGEGVAPEIMMQTLRMNKAQQAGFENYLQTRYRYFEELHDREVNLRGEEIPIEDLLEDAGNRGMAG